MPARGRENKKKRVKEVGGDTLIPGQDTSLSASEWEKENGDARGQPVPGRSTLLHLLGVDDGRSTMDEGG